jgi:hypothetical protein
MKHPVHRKATRGKISAAVSNCVSQKLANGSRPYTVLMKDIGFYFILRSKANAMHATGIIRQITSTISYLDTKDSIQFNKAEQIRLRKNNLQLDGRR